MAVYIDNMFARYRGMKMSHMLADSDAELHAMADRIGVERRHWQRPTDTCGSHYDIAMSKRALAIEAGAVPITRRQAAAMNARRRETGELGCPTDAQAWFSDYYANKKERKTKLESSDNVSDGKILNTISKTI